MNTHDINLMLTEGKLPKEDACLITIDDGHNSMLRTISPMLTKRDYGSIFFVSTKFIEKRQNFCSWQDLKKLSEQGVLVQPHGHTHQFFDTMTAKVMDDELVEPKELIETHILQPVMSMSYPGGRCNTLSMIKAYDHGYTLQFGSDVGLNLKDSDRCTYRRMAVRASTSHKEFSKIISFNVLYYFIAVIKQKMKKLLKLVCGSKGYHHLYCLVKR